MNKKELKREYDRQHYLKYKKRIQQYRLDNKKKIRLQKIKHYLKHRDKILQQKAQYRKKNIKKINQYHWDNREKILPKLREYRLKNKEKIKQKYLENRDAIIKQQREYRNRKYKTDLNFKLKTLLYSRLHGALRRKKRSFTIMKLTGTTLDKVWEHLKKNFYLNPKTGEQMTRYNRGFYGWHIDHIKPCASFDLRCPIGQLDCFHYTNLRPLWAFDNLSKGSKILDLRNKS